MIVHSFSTQYNREHFGRDISQERLLQNWYTAP